MRSVIVAITLLAASALAVGTAPPTSPGPAVHLAGKKHPQGGAAAAKGHHKSALGGPRKTVSRRAPMHLSALATRGSTSAQATAEKVLGLCDTMGQDQSNIHDLVLQLHSSEKSSGSGSKTTKTSPLATNAAYQKKVSAELAAWQKHASSIPTLTEIHQSLSYFGRDKGSANLNKQSELEEALKNIVNSIKYILADTDLLVYQIPVLGSTLGPIVYQIKCIVEDLLNGSENTVDGLVNSLGLATTLDVCAIVTSIPDVC